MTFTVPRRDTPTRVFCSPLHTGASVTETHLRTFSNDEAKSCVASRSQYFDGDMQYLPIHFPRTLKSWEVEFRIKRVHSFEIEVDWSSVTRGLRLEARFQERISYQIQRCHKRELAFDSNRYQSNKCRSASANRNSTHSCCISQYRLSERDPSMNL